MLVIVYSACLILSRGAFHFFTVFPYNVKHCIMGNVVKLLFERGTRIVKRFFNIVSAFVLVGVVVLGLMPRSSALAAEPVMTRADFAIGAIRSLGYSTLAEQIERTEASPFTDVYDNIGYIIMAHDLGIIRGCTNYGLFTPHDTITVEEANSILADVHIRLAASPDWVHGFYAIASFEQRGLIRDMDAVSFGWGVMEWDEISGPHLNTMPYGGNRLSIPQGYQYIINYPRENGATTHFSVFMDTSIGLHYMLACANSRSSAVEAILYEATRVYEGIGHSPFDGVTINFEGLRGAQSGSDFTAFLAELEARLRVIDLGLYVTVHPATIDGVYFDGYDLRAIGYLADRVILMAHDYHPRSLEGFVGTNWQRNSALTPIAEVYRALKVITDPVLGVQDRGKIAIAFSFPNIGWFIDENGMVTSPAPVAVAMETVIRRMEQPDTQFGWSETFRNPYIIYTTEDGSRVFLWYEDSRSVYEKLRLARLFGVNGASVWRLGIVPNVDGWDVWGNFIY